MKRTNNEKHENYWKGRSEKRMDRYHKDAAPTVATINRAYNKAQHDITDETAKIFNRFAIDGGLTPGEARKILNEPISKNEWNRIKQKMAKVKDPDIKRQLLTRLNAPAYKARITRLEALKENAYIQSKLIADVEIRATRARYMQTIDDAYHRNMFDLHRGLGIGFEFASIDAAAVQAILRDPWSGSYFADTVWKNTDVLAYKVSNIITAGFMSGVGIEAMTNQLAAQMLSSQFVANRVIRTEVTYMANAAEIAAYKEAEIEKYIFIATLDKRTSKICQDHDNKIYKVKDARAGKNLPSMHPFCRSTTRAYFGPDTLKNIQRRARNPKTGRNELVPATMDYKAWKTKYSRAG